MTARPGGVRLAIAALAVVLGVILLGGLFTGLQIVTGHLNMSDVLHRLPKPVAAAFVDDPDAASLLDCDGLDETDPVAVAWYAERHGLSVEYRPEGAVPARLGTVEWFHWRDRLVARAADERAEPDEPMGTACPG